MTTNLYRNYWATAGNATSGAYKAPQAGFQTVHVRDHQVRQIMQYRAMRAQYIRPHEITG